MWLHLMTQEISEPQVRALSIFHTRTLRRVCRMLDHRLVSFTRLDQSASTCFRTCLARLEPCISSRSKKTPAVKNLSFPLSPHCCAPVSSHGTKDVTRIGITYLTGALSLQVLKSCSLVPGVVSLYNFGVGVMSVVVFFFFPSRQLMVFANLFQILAIRFMHMPRFRSDLSMLTVPSSTGPVRSPCTTFTTCTILTSFKGMMILDTLGMI
jgi:hypothetical protein